MYQKCVPSAIECVILCSFLVERLVKVACASTIHTFVAFGEVHTVSVPVIYVRKNVI